MKGIITAVAICVCFVNCWSQSDSSRLAMPKLLQIATASLESVESLDSLILGDNFTVLSLVSPGLFDNWNAAELKSKVARKNVLIVVARQNDYIKTNFVASFYQNWLTTGSIQRAYELASEEFSKSTEIKHLLTLNEQASQHPTKK